jgi:hypothetical protein
MKIKRWVFPPLLTEIPQRYDYGLGGVYIVQQEGILPRDSQICPSWIFKLFSLNLFFFSFSGFVRILIFNFYFLDSQNFDVCKEEYV